ncbi:hypothetical protein CK203_036842 [Vitis vinifera]|uniref:Uncharacterized protein n=1 Tax=Vitis vinifera TaxID=29760 RepID=A0A438GXY2_VITVI|nr:hypothetical protein CK203_036842 [Vitis vinifera]
MQYFCLPLKIVLKQRVSLLEENGKILQSARWKLKTGCLLKEGSIRKAWMRMLGLPLHMWSWEEFMKIGNCCRGFVAVDEDTTYSSYLQWARILVKLDLRALASLFQVVVGSSTFSLQLWWETPLRFLKKVLRSYSSGTSNLEIGERGLVRLQLSAFLGVLIFWDNRMLDLIGMKVGEFSISYQFKNCDDDSCSVFSESYNKEVFGNVTSKKELALNYVVFWDSKEGTRLLTMKERDARQLAREEFKKWVLLEKTFWRQKSREIRLKEGDDEVVLPEVSFSEVEVFKTLSNLNGDKAPCPNGFSIKFRQFSWDFVNDEVMGFFRDFHEQDKFVKSLNASFWQILDASLITNEAINSLLKSNACGLICKLDIEKAYDHVNWNFLLMVLNKMGFEEKWTK